MPKTEEKGKHTETPWEVAHYEDGILEGLNFIRGKGRAHICSMVGVDDRTKEDTAFIVKAVNAYDGMLSALKRIRDAHYECLMDGKCSENNQLCIPCVTRFAIEKAESHA